ncbi:MAG: cytochrome C biosynthesis protein [Prevotellaceae bacterium]|nr:cytochrome C biosynthesis protein [Prevotellaceae bacterium]
MKKNIFLLLLLSCLLGACRRYSSPTQHINKIPSIYPDYTETTFPPNIAPPNFAIQAQAEGYQVEIGAKGVESIYICSDESTIEIPPKEWTAFLSAAKGKRIFFRISLLQAGEWVQYTDLWNQIATENIDGYLVYRLLYPGYELWNEMGIYERNLSNYEERIIVDNRDFGKQCVNCHSFSKQSPENMMLHIRGKDGGTIIRRNGKIEKVNPRPEGYKNGATYPAWHPKGKWIAFSSNEIQQFFHAAGEKTIEVSDLAADLLFYETTTHQTFTDSLVYGTDYMETFPIWAPDGNTLYFCRAKGYTEKTPLDSIRYDLYRVNFDAENLRLSNLTCVYEASAQGKSISFPQVSPNGKYLMFTLSDYGNFSIWHPESDLYTLNLESGEIRALEEVNSDHVDSYHTWDSSGHWFVVSSKRMDGLWARPFIAYFDERTGKAQKPFLLPQKDPYFYDHFNYTFNRPELIHSPIRVEKEILQAIRQPVIQATQHKKAKFSPLYEKEGKGDNPYAVKK